MLTTRRTGTSRDAGVVSESRPVLLATFDVPLLAEAAALAVDTSVENGQPLIVANVIGGRFFPTAAGVPAPQAIVHDDVEASLRAPAELAASLGVRAERLRVLTPRPVEALLELVAERRPGLVVIGADPARMSRRRYAKALRAVRERTSAIIWP